jgi:hypothetical protein
LNSTIKNKMDVNWNKWDIAIIQPWLELKIKRHLLINHGAVAFQAMKREAAPLLGMNYSPLTMVANSMSAAAIMASQNEYGLSAATTLV